MNNFLNKPIAIIGAGSIGERYIRVLNNLRFSNLIVYRRKSKLFKDIGSANVKVVHTFEDLYAESVFCAIIATPTNLHLEQAILLAEQGVHLLVEKPLSHTLDGINILRKIVEKNNIFIHIGYMMRFHPIILELKSIINHQEYGNLISIQSKWAEFLPDWHPWEDYRTSYASNKKMGGGVALTLSHDIDLAFYLAAGQLKMFSTYKNYCPSLEIDVESSADIILKFDNNIIANIHLNFFEKIKERFTKLCFENASVNFSYFENKLVIKNKEIEIVKIIDCFERDDLFRDQLVYFFSILSSNNYYHNYSIENLNTSSSIIKICTE